MKKYVLMTCPDIGTEYEVPMDAIAAFMAVLLAKKAIQDGQQPDDQALARWLENPDFSMLPPVLSWRALVSFVRMVKWTPREPDLKKVTFSEPYDEPRKADTGPVELQHGIPLDILLSSMWEQRAPLTVNVFSNSDGEIKGAMIFALGSKDEVAAYVGVCQQLADQIDKQPRGAPKPARRPYRH